MKKLIISLVLISFFLISCDRIKDEPGLFPEGRGLFILNEGNFLAGNGSVSFYSPDSAKIYNDLFSATNNRLLGDIPTYLAVRGDRGYIIVNNSGTIEEVDIHNMHSIKTLTKLSSPRQMAIYNGKGYVSSLSSEYIYIIDLEHLSLSDSIKVNSTTESLIVAGGRLFAAHWAGGSDIVVVDLSDNSVETTIQTGMEPESMVLDKNGKLWVLCTGGYMNEEIPRIIRINTATLSVESEMLFRTNTDCPSSLAINNGGDTLYYIDEGIRRMTITASSLPSTVLVPANGRLLYKLAAAPWNGAIYATDAVDYQQKGNLLVFDKSGNNTDEEQAGIIPGFMYFTE